MHEGMVDTSRCDDFLSQIINEGKYGQLCTIGKLGIRPSKFASRSLYRSHLEVQKLALKAKFSILEDKIQEFK